MLRLVVFFEWFTLVCYTLTRVNKEQGFTLELTWFIIQCYQLGFQ